MALVILQTPLATIQVLAIRPITLVLITSNLGFITAIIFITTHHYLLVLIILIFSFSFSFPF